MSWIRSMVADGINDSVSSKRVVTIFAFALCSLGFICDLFWDLKVGENIYEGMMYIVIAGLGFTASEKFTKKENEK